MSRVFQAFVRVTGWLPQKLVFRTRFEYEDRAVQSRRLRGPVILVCNHTSLYDFAALLFAFPFRTLRVQMAEVLFRKKVLGAFLKGMGGIYVDREAHRFGFMEESLEILRKGGAVGIFPEGRLPRPGEETPLAFQPGAAYLSLESGVPIVPVWTNGAYFTRKRARMVIGTPLTPDRFSGMEGSGKEKITQYTRELREKIIQLKELAHE